jgi:hypothetical protein
MAKSMVRGPFVSGSGVENARRIITEHIVPVDQAIENSAKLVLFSQHTLRPVGPCFLG